MSNDATKSVTVAVRTTPETKEQLETLARNMGRSTNNVINEALSAYVAENAWQVEAIREAVEQADAGGPFISQEAVERWMRSWGTDQELPMPEPDAFR